MYSVLLQMVVTLKEISIPNDKEQLPDRAEITNLPSFRERGALSLKPLTKARPSTKECPGRNNPDLAWRTDNVTGFPLNSHFQLSKTTSCLMCKIFHFKYY